MLTTTAHDHTYDFGPRFGARPVMTAAQERDLARVVRAGAAARATLAATPDHPDAETLLVTATAGCRARTEFIEANVRLAARLARDLTGRGVPYPDLVHEGVLGLLHAIDKYDPERGVRFASYGALWARQYMTRAIDRTARIIRVPSGAQFPAPPPVLSLDEVTTEDGHPRGEHVRDLHTLSPEGWVLRADGQSLVAHLVGSLDPALAAVVRARFGLDGDTPRTVAQTADLLGISVSAVRTREAKALRTLRRTGRTTARGALEDLTDREVETL